MDWLTLLSLITAFISVFFRHFIQLLHLSHVKYRRIAKHTLKSANRSLQVERQVLYVYAK